MYLKNQAFLVLGLSRSGKAAAEFLLKSGANVYLYDDVRSERLMQTLQELLEKGAKQLKSEELGSACESCDALVLSPGIAIDHPLAVAFKRNNKAVIGETELAARYMQCNVVAVTGTNGKTTTVSMLAQTLKEGGFAAHACGNIGMPMLEYVDLPKDTVAVAEISSFQMETLNSLRPHIAVILNITEDHLNRHYNMENYAFLKGKLLKNSTETEYAVLNYDDSLVRAFAEKTKARTVWFSLKEQVNGAYLQGEDLYYKNEKIMPVQALALGGVHNIQNALACIAVCKLMGMQNRDIQKGLSTFKGVEHRIQPIGEVDGVAFVNDSKGTNVDATIKAVESMKKQTVLLLGGKHKGYAYERLFAALKSSKVVHAVLYGENRYELLKAAQKTGYHSFSMCDNFSFAVLVAAMKAERGQTVLLSPASASFDEFSSYEERGRAFVEIVRSLRRDDKTQTDNQADECLAQEEVEQPKQPECIHPDAGIAETNRERDEESE